MRKRRNKYAAREHVQVWYPRAHDMALPNVPVELRRDMRLRISPWLTALADAGRGIKVSDCWNVAQGFVVTANDPVVLYVEGVYCDEDEVLVEPFVCDCGCNVSHGGPIPHGWATVDGQIVDLAAEFLDWRGGPCKRAYEPSAVYTNAQIVEANEDDLDSWGVLSRNLFFQSEQFATLPEEWKKEWKDFEQADGGGDEEYCAYLEAREDFVHEKVVFESAKHRIIERYKPQAVAA
jgi:hypothetical protein